MTVELRDGIRIAWSADGFDSIHVLARRRTRTELEGYARGVADAALLNRSLADLRRALREAFPAAFDMETAAHDEADPHVVVRFHPPRGEPNPDF